MEQATSIRETGGPLRHETATTDRDTGRIAVSVEDAARLLSVSSWGIRRWIAQGKLKASRLGTRVVIPYEELRRFLDAGRNAPPKRKPRA